MSVLRFTVPGTVRGWARARLGRSKTGKPVHYMDAQTASYEASWAALAHKAMLGAPLMEGALSVYITARFTPPKSASKVKTAEMLAGLHRPTSKPDLDNIVKNLDALNGVAFRDDCQIAAITASKVYAETPGVDVSIFPMGPA